MLPVGLVSAQQKGIGLGPALQELTLEEGQTSVSFTLQLSNTTDEVADLRLSALDFGALDESGGIAFIGRSEQETTSYGLKEWLVLEKNQLTLAPGESQDVKVTVENKESLSPGGHYGAVIVSGAGGSGSQDNVAVLPAASSLVLLKKQGGEVEKLGVESIKTNKSWFRLPSDITIRFQNSGNTHVVPRGTIELFNPAGSLIGRGTINPDSSFVLPETFRQVPVELNGQAKPWLPGRYKLVTTWRHDSTEQTQQQVVHVWYIGTLTLWIVGIACLAIVLFLYIRYRRRPPTRAQ